MRALEGSTAISAYKFIRNLKHFMLIAKQVDFLNQSDGSFARKFWQDSRQKRLLVWSFLDVKHEGPKKWLKEQSKIKRRRNWAINQREIRWRFLKEDSSAVLWKISFYDEFLYFNIL